MKNQTILKKQKRNNYTVLDNGLLQNSDLSFEARGLAVSLLSRPDNWDINVSAICKEGGIGREKVNRIISELIKAGYMYRSQIRTSGKFGKNVLFISDEKDYLFTEVIEKEQSLPQSEKPCTVKPQTVNPQQLSKDFNKVKNITNTTTKPSTNFISRKQKKENKKESSSYEFLNNKNLSPVTINLINKNIPELKEKTFNEIYNQIKKQNTSGKFKSFDAVLYQALKGEWIIDPKVEKQIDVVKASKSIANYCLSYLDVNWNKQQIYELLKTSANTTEIFEGAKKIIDGYFEKGVAC